MKQRRISKSMRAAVLTFALALGGCLVVPDRPGYEGGVVMLAPPVPQVEVVGVAPRAGFVWIGGYWNWVGGRHVWVGGRWGAPPRAGYRWVPHEWVSVGGGWRLRRGHWARP